MSNPIFIIAEAGVNHNGERDMAFQLVDAAVDAGADAVKFQTFVAEHVTTKLTKKAVYQQRNSGKDESQYEMLKKLELPHELHYDLIDYCKGKKILFLSTAFDFESLEFLYRKLALKILKIASGEITNGPFLLAHARTGKALILSTGMASMGEIEEALGVLAFGYLSSEKPSRAEFQEVYCSKEGQQVLKEKVTLLHCTSEYPVPMHDINLKAMITLRDAFGLKVGYSDHSEGISVATAAAALGATLIEKHFTLDKHLQGPDHKASLNPVELKEMVSAIHSVEQALGTGVKCVMPMELDNKNSVRKCIVAKCKIVKGENYSKHNLTFKRTEQGLNPMNYWDMLGTPSHHNYEAGDVLR